MADNASYFSRYFPNMEWMVRYRNICTIVSMESDQHKGI